MLVDKQLCYEIVGAAIEVHRETGGPGMLEAVYEECLKEELEQKGLKCDQQVRVPLKYKGKSLSRPLIIDLLVENKVIIEVKAVDRLHPIYRSQLITYLRMTGLSVGLVINFGADTIKVGLMKVVHTSSRLRALRDKKNDESI